MNKYSSVRGFAMEYGTFLGIAWFIDFLLLVKGMDGYVSVMLLGTILFLALPIITFYLAFRFKQHQEVGDRHSMMEAAYFTLLLFIFAEIICFIAEYIYFACFDEGHLVASFSSLLSNPAIVNEYRKMGMTEMLDMAQAQIEQIGAMSPIDKASSLFGSNIFTSCFLFIPTWFIATLRARKRANRVTNNNQQII